jgi:arsenate reductase-like glutaredoxin family protein
VNAKKQTLGADEAMELVKKVSQIFAAKGKKVVHLDLRKEKPDEETLKKHLLGPTDNLRAPTLRKGKTMIVGFNEETYKSIFG